jgi:hypothetical protein
MLEMLYEEYDGWVELAKAYFSRLAMLVHVAMHRGDGIGSSGR